MCMWSIQQGDWNAFGDGNLWPLYSPLTCEPRYHKLLTVSTELVNGVTLYELRVWVSAVKRVHMLTQINTHMHTPTSPRSINIAFSTSGTSSGGWRSGSITACLVYWRKGCVLRCTPISVSLWFKSKVEQGALSYICEVLFNTWYVFHTSVIDPRHKCIHVGGTGG